MCVFYYMASWLGLMISLPVLEAAGVCQCVGGMWGRLDAVRQDVGEDLLEQDYPTIFGERASWSSDHS